jgi:hypothetical protein
MSEPVRCSATKADGSPCEVDWALSEAGLCPAHDPERHAARMVGMERSIETRQAKAERRRTSPEGMPEGQPKTLADCVQWSGWVSHAVASGTIDNRAAEIILKGIGELRQSLDKKELEERLYRVEKLAKEGRR